MMKLVKRHKILLFSCVGYLIVFLYDYELALKGLSESKYYFIEMVKIMPAIFILTAMIQTWVPTKVIMDKLGDQSGFKGKLLSFAIGSLSAGPIYAAFPVCKTLLNKGASIQNIVIILSSWAVVKVPMLINEAKFMGMQYMVVRWILTIISIFIMAFIMKIVVKSIDVEQSKNKDGQLIIDEKLCVGCGLCSREYPNLYEMKNGKAVIKIDNLSKVNPVEIQSSKEKCPMGAID
ncbi:permease [Vallitalea okinawensis]|uniref:permease n=1 Tax=Vallitalea okinawensis TaxID=2078660 RepID=UPI000CFA8A69|nr:permease [Vallitalea okinawensis]